MQVELQQGRSYRLRRDLSHHDAGTGIYKETFKKGTVLKITKVDQDRNEAYVEGSDLVLPVDVLARMVDPVE